MASSSDREPRRDATSSPDAARRVANGSQSDLPGSSQRFPRSCRLTARSQFREIYAKGRRVGCPSFTFFGLPNSVGHSRIGITATRKFGSAVLRNRAKRVLRDCFRRNRSVLDPPMDLVINVHPRMRELRTEILEREFLGCFRRLTRRGSGR